jgi:hypothetical protein
MSQHITSGPLNNERFAVTGHSILAVKPHSNPTGPTYRHDWTEWFRTRDDAQEFLATKASRSTPTAKYYPEAIHELDAATAAAMTEDECSLILAE